MQCSISQLTYTYPHPQQIKQLNLSSTSSIKIHEIAHLQNFTRLRVLVLSNNMISFMGGLQRLVQLRVINLEFNRIRVVQGTGQLAMLQEMFLGYNEIQRVTDCVLSNSKLRVLHLAYNDIRTLDSISILYHNSQSPSLPNLTTLSLYGNPITSTINYLSFFKMLIPSLCYMDDKSLDDDLMGGAVCPQEEVLILREAISNLLDERDEAVERLQGFVQGEGKGRKSVSPVRPVPQQIRAADLKTERTNSQILKYLQSTKQKYTTQLQTQREKISKISQLYTQNLKHSKSKTPPCSPDYNYLADEQQSPEKSPASVEQGWLQSNKEIIRELKIEDQRLQDTQEKIRNVNRIIGYIRDRMAGGDEDVYRVVLQMVLFGFQLKEGLSLANCQKLCKKYLIKSSTQTGEGQPELTSGLIQYSQLLKKVIYGQHSNPPKSQLPQLLKLKTKIRNKGLLQIITQLKQISSQECSKSSKFEKEKKQFIEQFEKQSEELSRAWDQLKREKEKFQSEKRKEIREIGEEMGRKELEMRRKFKIAEEEERAKIVQLKRSRERLEDDQERIKLELAETQQRLNRKYTQLQQFQAHFNEFIVQKQQIKSLEEQINEITNSLHTEKQRHETLVDRVKQLTLEQGILQSKLTKCEETLSQRSKDLMEIQKLKNQTVKLYEKYKGEVEREAEKLRELTAGLARKVEEVRDYERMGDRMKKNLGLLEEKVRNIEQMEQSKKQAIKQLQLSLKQLKQDKEILLGQTDSLDKNIQQKREQLIKCQLKLQQNRLAMQNLSDLNRSVNDMMIRQSELKRSIIELEIQNKNLMDMKNSLMGDYRIKNYL